MPFAIVAFVANLMFQTRVESVAQKLGYQVHWIESTQVLESVSEDLRAALGSEGLLVDRLARLNPHLLIFDLGLLVDRLARLNPHLLIFDLGNAAIPWERWIPALKTIPATRRIPLICFGSHVEVDTLRKARQAGADAVVARSRFVTALPDLIEKYARRTETDIWAETCGQALHPKAIRGLELFNQGDYFAAHEWLEEAWMEDLSPGRDLYRGVLQVAVAYFQIQKQNYRGALKMFQRARYWLAPIPHNCRGMDVAAFRAEASAVHDRVLALGSERIAAFDAALLKPVRWQVSNI